MADLNDEHGEQTAEGECQIVACDGKEGDCEKSKGDEVTAEQSSGPITEPAVQPGLDGVAPQKASNEAKLKSTKNIILQEFEPESSRPAGRERSQFGGDIGERVAAADRRQDGWLQERRTPVGRLEQKRARSCRGRRGLAERGWAAERAWRWVKVTKGDERSQSGINASFFFARS